MSEQDLQAIQQVTIVGTGLIGASIGLALRQAGFTGRVTGIDTSPEQRSIAISMAAIDEVAHDKLHQTSALEQADAIVLAVPVLAVLDWMQRLAPMLGPHQLVTDAGSTKLRIAESAQQLYNTATSPQFLPGHPMAGKESGGASLAEAQLFSHAMWLFTPVAESTPLTREWRGWVARFGCRTMDIDPLRHDKLCAWVSHLPQMAATALAALFEDEFGDAEEIKAIGGRALREMTRLGASPYSMWRDVAMTNTQPLAATLFAFEQRLAHVRENLRTPELREEFSKANAFRRED